MQNDIKQQQNTTNEFLFAKIRAALKKKSVKALDVFDIIDKDADGYVSHGELRLGLKRQLGLELTGDEFKLMVNNLDPDGTGEIEVSVLVQKVNIKKVKKG